MKEDLFEKPQMVMEAAQAQKGKFWILEILLFLVVSFVTDIAIEVVSSILTYLFGYNGAVAATGSFLSDIQIILSKALNIVIILVVCLFCKILQKRKMTTLGFYRQDAVKEYLIGLLGGFACFSLAVLFSAVLGGIRIEVSPAFSLQPIKVIGIFLCFVIGFVFQGMAEEVLCRGYFLVSYARRYPVYAAILANALLFTSFHLANSGLSAVALINVFSFGIFMSVYFVRRGNIWGISAFHTIWNAVQGNFYGMKVSGNDNGSSIFTTTSIQGKELLNGGDFGLEGSIIVTVIFVIGTLFVYFGKQNKHAA